MAGRFGHVPGCVGKRVQPDEHNRIPLATVHYSFKMVVKCCWKPVLEFFDPKLRERYGAVEAEHVLLKSVRISVTEQDIVLLFLSHLHFIMQVVCYPVERKSEPKLFQK